MRPTVKFCFQQVLRHHELHVLVPNFYTLIILLQCIVGISLIVSNMSNSFQDIVLIRGYHTAVFISALKPERRQQPETKSRAVVDRGLDIQCESKKIPPWGLVAIFRKRLKIFQPNFACLLRIPIYARLRIFIQISASLMKLCHIKRDHPVKIMCAKCPPSAKTHFLTFFPNS